MSVRRTDPDTVATEGGVIEVTLQPTVANTQAKVRAYVATLPTGGSVAPGGDKVLVTVPPGTGANQALEVYVEGRVSTSTLSAPLMVSYTRPTVSHVVSRALEVVVSGFAHRDAPVCAPHRRACRRVHVPSFHLL